ncbi:YXWGXW repeat-containing protein [Dyella choica]|uniref:YXWGXW repeat-containing protein n=1 Tax=Dyella choica TaxID=1927959 RepID=A0A3S0PG51_9GAMM|nr:YXWGXW repeat-containing protein [Dyella choica]RUL71115.1 hypothetical protein EKH80_19415 [Dyella choica]
MKTLSLTQQVSKRTLLVRALAGLLGAVAAFAALPQKAEAGVFVGVGVSVGLPPPPLPVYEQPPIPGSGYIWTPGYWAWDGDEYYWVPGTWVVAPFYGALWTPGYWGWDDGFYAFHAGYWGYHVGFYGGIDYGCGYGGRGYEGGYWGPRGFYYNRTVNHITNVNVTNIYNKTVINNVNVNRVSYNGGHGGVMAHATPQEMTMARQSRMGPIAAQQQQMKLASQTPAMRASFNHGNPPIAATQHPGAFSGAGVTQARGAPAMASAPNMLHPGANTGQFASAAANAQRMNNSLAHAPQADPGHGTALRSANFAPHANMAGVPNRAQPSANTGQFTPAAANPQRMNNNVAHASQAQPNNNMAMHSANFAPHANAAAAPSMSRPGGGYSNTYRPGGAAGATPTSHPGQPMNMNTYRAPATAYHAAPAFHPAPVYRPQPQPQYRAPAAPEYHAYRPAPAPHPTGAAPHGGGGQRDAHHG